MSEVTTFEVGDKVLIRAYQWGTDRLEPANIIRETKTQYITDCKGYERFKKLSLVAVGSHYSPRLAPYCEDVHKTYLMDRKIAYYRQRYRSGVSVLISEKLTREEVLEFGKLIEGHAKKYKKVETNEN